MFKNIFNLRFLYLFLISFLLLTLPNGLFYAFDKDEPKYLHAAKYMLKDKNYILPYFNGEIRFDKPILVYYLILLGYKLFHNIDTFSGRFFPSLFGVLTILLLYLWLSKYKSKNFAFLVSLTLLTTLEFVIMSSLAMPDTPLLFFIFSSFVFLFEGYKENKNIYYYLASILIGLGTLTKGPVTLALPALGFLMYLILEGKLKETLKKFPIFSFTFIFLLITLPWYILAYKTAGKEFIDKFIIFHNIKRFLGKIPGHPSNSYYYLINFLWAYFPYTFFAFVSIFYILKILKDKLFSYSFVNSFIIISFFQKAKTKLIHYILPSFPFLSILSTYTYLSSPNFLKEILVDLSYVLVFLTFIGVSLYTFMITGSLFSFIPLLIYLFYFLLSLFYFRNLLGLAHFTLILFVSIKYIYLPLLNDYRIKEKIAFYIKEKLKTKPVYFFNYFSPEIIFYSDRKQIKNINLDNLNKTLKKDIFIITNFTGYDKLKHFVNLNIRKIIYGKEYFGRDYLYLLEVEENKKN